MKKLDVALGERSYPIFIGSGLLGQDKISVFVGNEVMVVSNTTVAPLYLDKIQQQLTGLKVNTVILEDGEQFKNWQTLNQIFDGLLEHHHARTTTLIALGGGVVGDMTGFAAASYQRGVNFVQVPTTLLAQVDSSVGGKTAINHPLGKNMIGAFHQPVAVVIDTDVLDTLPDKEFAAGLAEVIKYGLIRDGEFFAWLEANIDQLLARDKEALAFCIERSCWNKAQVVVEDEKEGGVRATLNLGHTFGHAMETFTEYKSWLHGEAVAAGMVMACEFSVEQGWLDRSIAERAERLLIKCGLPTKGPSGMRSADYLELMSHDKKVRHGQLRLVLLEGLGQAVVTANYDQARLVSYLERYCAQQGGD